MLWVCVKESEQWITKNMSIAFFFKCFVWQSNKVTQTHICFEHLFKHNTHRKEKKNASIMSKYDLMWCAKAIRWKPKHKNTFQLNSSKTHFQCWLVQLKVTCDSNTSKIGENLYDTKATIQSTQRICLLTPFNSSILRSMIYCFHDSHSTSRTLFFFCFAIKDDHPENWSVLCEMTILRFRLLNFAHFSKNAFHAGFCWTNVKWLYNKSASLKHLHQ